VEVEETRLTGPARVIVVPGLAVHAYVELPVQHLRAHGYDARLLQPPAWRGVEHDLEATAAIWQLTLIAMVLLLMC
jgi:hypothetical protein